MADIVKRTPSFSVPPSTNIVEFLKKLQHWAIESENEEVRRRAKSVADAFKNLDELLEQKENLVRLLRHELNNCCEQVLSEHRARANVARTLQDLRTEYDRFWGACAQQLNDLGAERCQELIRYWNCWRELLEKLELVVKRNGSA